MFATCDRLSRSPRLLVLGSAVGALACVFATYYASQKVMTPADLAVWLILAPGLALGFVYLLVRCMRIADRLESPSPPMAAIGVSQSKKSNRSSEAGADIHGVGTEVPPKPIGTTHDGRGDQFAGRVDHDAQGKDGGVLGKTP
jgi:hypothetical protein